MFDIGKHIRETLACFKEAMAAYRNNFKAVILASAFLAILAVVISTATNMATYGMSFKNAFLLNFGFGYGAGFMQAPAIAVPLSPIGYIFAAIALLSFSLLSAYVSAGFYGVCLSAINKKTDISEFFRSMNKYGLSMIGVHIVWLIAVAALIPVSLLAFAVMYALAYFAGMILSVSLPNFLLLALMPVLIILLIAVGISFMPFFVFLFPAVVSGKGVIGSFKESIRTGKKAYWKIWLLLLAILLGLIILVIALVIAGIIIFAGLYSTGALPGVSADFLPPAIILFSIVNYFIISPIVWLIISSAYLKFGAKRDGESGSENTGIKKGLSGGKASLKNKTGKRAAEASDKKIIKKPSKGKAAPKNKTGKRVAK